MLALSYGARRRGLCPTLGRLLTGGHEDDAYATCANAMQRTSSRYARVLRSPLTDDVRALVERQISEIEEDELELRCLRWGGRRVAAAARA